MSTHCWVSDWWNSGKALAFNDASRFREQSQQTRSSTSEKWLFASRITQNIDQQAVSEEQRAAQDLVFPGSAWRWLNSAPFSTLEDALKEEISTLSDFF